jgi:hypothetical protein
MFQLFSVWFLCTLLILQVYGQTPIPLQNSIPVAGSVNTGSFTYFSFNVTSTGIRLGVPVRIVVTATGGDPDLYVTNSTVLPTLTSYTWSVATSGPEVLTILPTDPSYGGSSGYYTIGVYGYNALASFTVFAAEQVVNYTIPLTPGVEQAELASPHGFSYFSYTVPSGPLPSELDFSVTPLVGTVDLYVSVHGVYPQPLCANPAPGMPSDCTDWSVVPGTYDFSSVAAVAGVAGFVAVPSSALSPGMTVIVGVFATSPDGYLVAPPSLFAVAGAPFGTSFRLANGVPIASSAGAGVVRSFNFTFYSPDNIVVSTEFSGGSIDLFASATSPIPGPGNNGWNSTASGGFSGRRRLINIPYSALGASVCPNINTPIGCTIFISAIGAPNMSPGVVAGFTLVAAVTGDPNNPSPLINGQQVLTQILPTTNVYFAGTVNIDPSQSIYVIAADVSSGGAITMYVSLGPNAVVPNPANNYIANVSTSDMGGYARAIFSPTSPYGGYCSSCPIFVTLRSTSSSSPSDVGLLFVAGPNFVPLLDSQPNAGVLSANGSAFFTFDVTDSLADVTFTFNQVSGSILAYVTVVSPLRPYRAPSIAYHMYTVQPDVGSSTLTIKKSDPLWCAPPGGAAPPGLPCSYSIGIYPADPTAILTEFSVVGTADSSGAFVQLLDGQQTDGTVTDSSFSYYLVMPVFSVAPIIISADAYSGSVAVYVVNSYIPGVSTPASLPSSTNFCWKSVDRSPIVISATDPCFSSAQTVYTVAVQGVTGIPNFVTPFHITAAFNQPYQTMKLELGIPLTNINIPANTNAYFAFDLPSVANDLIVTASPFYGQISAAVSKHGFQAANDPPSCSSNIPGALGYCTNYIWLASGIAGASSMRIPAANPCSPTTGFSLPAPLVNNTPVGASTACALAWRPGRYWFVVFAWKDSVVSVAVQVAGKPITLSDGQQQLALTAPVTLCSQRNPLSGNCMGDPSTWLTTTGAFLRFRAPELLSVADQSLLIERICQNDWAGICGNQLKVYVHSCVLSQCTSSDPFASMILNEASATVSDSLVAFNFPSCYGSNPPGTDDCVYSVGIFPMCSPVGPAGVNCSDALARVTWAGDSTPQMLPADCTSNDRACTIPPLDVGIASFGGVRRFASYASDFNSAIVVNVTACTGAVSTYLCTNMANSKCNPADYPSSKNYDVTANSVNDAAGRDIAQMSYQPSLQSNFEQPFFFGVAADVANGGVANPTFSITLASSNAQVLILPSAAASPIAIRYPSYVLIEWLYPVITNFPVTTGVLFTVYVFSGANPSPAYNLASPCGIDAYVASLPQGLLPTVYSTTTTSFNISSLDPSVTYTIAVKATCSASICAPANLQTMYVAYNPGTLTRVVSASASPMPAPGGNTKSSMAGPVIGGIIGVGLALGGGYFAYRRWGSSLLGSSPTSAGGMFYRANPIDRSALASSSTVMAAKDDGALYSAL